MIMNLNLYHYYPSSPLSSCPSLPIICNNNNIKIISSFGVYEIIYLFPTHNLLENKINIQLTKKNVITNNHIVITDIFLLSPFIH